MAAERLHINSKVTKAGISRETINGREHFKVTSRTMPFGITMNRGLYPKETIEKNFQKLNGTYAPLGHPEIDGEYISAFDPLAINTFYAGAWNVNARIEGNRVTVDKMIDIEFAKNTPKGKELIERLEQLEKGEGDPISTSVAVFLKKMEANDAQKKQGIDWVADIESVDHDAILLSEAPAASVEQGVGIMVNSEEAVELQANEDALTGETYRAKEQRIRLAAVEKFKTTDDDYIYVEDFTDEQAIIYRGKVGAEVYGYKSEGGRIVFEDTGTAVVIKQSWITKNPIVNKLLQTFGLFDVKSQQQKPVTTNMEGAMPITAEEKADLVKTIGESVSGLLAPLAAEVKAIQANQVEIKDAQAKLASDLTANARAEEAEKRVAIAAVHGEVVANALQGEALEAMYKGLGKAAPIVNGKNGDGDKQDFSQAVE